MQDKKLRKVLVVGRNYCSNLCMARSFGEVGYEVNVLRVFENKPAKKNLMSFLKPDAFSKYVTNYQVCILQKDNQRIVDKIIEMADPIQKNLLIPIDDLVVAVVDEHYDILSEYYLISNIHNKSGEICRLMNKETQKNMAKKFGLPTVKSCVIRTQNGCFEIPESVKYPCFIKPNISKNSTKSMMKKCGDEKELREALEFFSEKSDIEMLVEDYIEIKKEYSLLGLSTKQGVIGPGFFEVEEGGRDSSKGVALIGRILSCMPRQALIDNFLKFVETLGYEGLFDIDMIESTEGIIYFVELNLRYGASGYVVTHNGANLPGMFADYMFEEKPIDMECKIKNSNVVFVNEKMLLEEYAKRLIDVLELIRKLKRADMGFIRNESDKKPYQHFMSFYWIATLARVYFMITAKKNFFLKVISIIKGCTIFM